jgi:hypothetical protein
MKVSAIRAIFLLLFCSKRFNRLAREHANAQRKEVEWQFSETSTHNIRKALCSSFMVVLSAVVTGYVTAVVLAKAFGPASGPIIQALQYLGIGIVLWTTLSKGGWAIQTIKGQSLPEKVDQWIYRGLYFVGSYFLVVSASWPVING